MKPKKKSQIQFDKRRTVFAELTQFCLLAKEDDFIEVTEWVNGEGYDVVISSKLGNRVFSLTYGEFLAIRKLIKAIEKA